jgi:hypothetical protein
MKRRTFIYTGITIATAFGLFGVFFWNKESKWKKQPFLYPLILSRFLDDESLRVIGKSYRMKQPGEDYELILMNAIKSGMHTTQIRPNDLESQAMEIEKNVEIDFKTNKFTVIKGWIISETEARQCALLSLS